jgi:S1-C subfamily serine protease
MQPPSSDDEPIGAPPGWGEHEPYRRSPRRGLAAMGGIVLLLIASAVVFSNLVQLGSGGGQQNVLGSIFSGNGSLDVASISSRVSPAVVDITAAFPDGVVAGTGMVITANGEVLTNNHVVDGADEVQAQVGGTGTVYRARVVGTDPNADVALLQLSGASELPTISVGGAASTGEAVVAIGNALGREGPPSASQGHVTATDQTITATDQTGADSETLTGLIQVNADVLPGDSGGPLVDGNGRVIGMDTAASARRFRFSTGASEGFAIPIATAMSVVGQLRSGGGSSGGGGGTAAGQTALLGVDMSDLGSPIGSGVAVADVVPGSPADSAGIAAGDVIRSIDSTSVSSATQLRAVIRSHRPGDRVLVEWVDASGQDHAATVQLAAAAS